MIKYFKNTEDGNVIKSEIVKNGYVHENLRVLISDSKSLGLLTGVPTLRYKILHCNKILYFIPHTVSFN